jgi:AcrR family transcriptional regulator
MTTSESTVRKTGRPRSIQSHQAILKATLELQAGEGIEGMSIEDVAARAGVGEATIYRRWASKDDLIIDAILALCADVPVIDTGNIRNDLITLMQKAFQARSRNPLFTKVVFKLVSEVESNPAIFQAFYSRIIAPRMQQLGELLERAQARGQLRPDLNAVFVFNL